MLMMLCSALVTDTIGMSIVRTVMLGARLFSHRYSRDLRYGLFCIAKLVAQLQSSHEGSFLAGLIIPREGGLAIALTKRLEDMVTIIFLPLVSQVSISAIYFILYAAYTQYFTIAGLATDFSLLNNGITWVYTIGIISIAWVGKFGGCMIAARISGFRWREAMSIGTLMSCKG